MNYNEKTRWMIMTLAIVLALTARPARSLAISGGFFELDGDAMDNPAVTGDDWDLLVAGGGNPSVFTFVADPAPQSVFTGGGSKDIYDIPKWSWKDGSVPDKDNITNAYAAGYIAAADSPQNNVDKGDLLIYFGCDRSAVNGDAFLGFWFFQDMVSLGSSGGFDGHHLTGDILILVDFPQGTKAGPTIKVIKWNPANPTAAQNLELIASGTVPPGSAAVCSSGEEACATTNLTPSPAPWAYTPKSGTPGTFPPQAFFEGGINLTKLLGSTPCFSSFVCESRSSEQFTATLKDFVLGQFPVCAIDVNKVCQVVRLATPADNTDKYFVVDFEGDVTNAGQLIPAGAVLTVVDDAGTPSDISDDVIVTVTLPNDLPMNETVHFSGQFFSNSNPPLNTVNASISFLGATVSAKPFPIECTKLNLNPVLTLDKVCKGIKLVTVGDVLAIQVNVEITVSVSGNVPLTVTASDPNLPSVNGSTTGNVLKNILMNPGDTKTIEASYLPSQANGGVDNPCTAVFSDTVSATATSNVPGIGTVTATPVTANCKLCDCP